MSKKSILQNLLARLARRTIKKYHPLVIGITGSVGKTSARIAAETVLNKRYRVRAPEKNHNNEIGLPLTILGIPHGRRSPLRWFSGLCRAWWHTVGTIQYPEVLILEYGIDHPGDMDYLLSIVWPNIAIITPIGDVPVHVEYFNNPEDLIHEKTKLVAALPTNGYALLNHDDYAVYDMKEHTRAHVLTYGFEENADIRITNLELCTAKDADLGDIPEGISFKIEYGGEAVPVRLEKAFGVPQATAAAAGVCAGLVLNMNLAESALGLRDYTPPPGRLRLLKGIKKSFILDDTYNAAPEAMRMALDTLRNLPGKRKIAVLGDMLEIGTYTEQVHRAIGDETASFVDLLVTVGARAKFIADEAVHRGIEKNPRRLLPEQVIMFDDAISAGRALDPLIQEGDLILVKGSRGMQMERAVEEIMLHPEYAGALLVRQDAWWKNQP